MYSASAITPFSMSSFASASAWAVFLFGINRAFSHRIVWFWDDDPEVVLTPWAGAGGVSGHRWLAFSFLSVGCVKAILVIIKSESAVDWSIRLPTIIPIAGARRSAWWVPVDFLFTIPGEPR
jgi:hypothetical protein